MSDGTHADFLAKLADEHQAKLGDAIVNLEDKITDLLSGAPLTDGEFFDLEWAVESRNELRKIIDKEYLAEVDKIVKDYSGVAERATDMLSEYGDFTKLDTGVVRQLQTLTFQGFESVGDQYLSAVSKEIYDMTLVGTSFSDAVKNVRDTVSGNLKRYADQQVHDGLMQFNANANVAIGKQSGVTKWKYYGGLQDNSRSHCRKHVGKVYTEEEIAEIWSGSWQGKASGDPFVVRGGYRCQHHWRPVFDEEVVSQVEEKVEVEPDFTPPKTLPKLKAKQAAISSVVSKLAKSTKKPKDFRDQSFDKYHVDFNGDFYHRFKAYGHKKSNGYTKNSQLFKDQIGKIIEGSMSPETLTLLDDALDMTAGLAVKFKVPNIRSVTPVTGKKATMSMGDGRLAINPSYWNPKSKIAYEGTEKATKKLAAKRLEVETLRADVDDLLAKYRAEQLSDTYDIGTLRSLASEHKTKRAQLIKAEKAADKLENALPKPASTWQVGDDIADRPWSAKEYFDTPEEQFANTVRHEFGHLVHQEHNRTGVEGGFGDLESPIETYLQTLFYRSGTKGGTDRNEKWVYPSEYSEANHKEWWAESFSLYNGGRKDLVEPKLVELMDHMVENEGRLTTFDGWDFIRGKRA